MSTLLNIATAEYVVGALAGWWFVIGYHLRTHGTWRRSREGWHLMTFTGCITVVFTLAAVIRVIGRGWWTPYAAVILYGFIVAGLVWRDWLMQTATRNPKDRRRS